MRGKYYTNSIGESLQKIDALKQINSPTNILINNWENIAPHSIRSLKPYKLWNGILTVTSEIPIIYVQHFGEDIKNICNHYLGQVLINTIRFKYVQ